MHLIKNCNKSCCFKPRNFIKITPYIVSYYDMNLLADSDIYYDMSEQ